MTNSADPDQFASSEANWSGQSHYGSHSVIVTVKVAQKWFGNAE